MSPAASFLTAFPLDDRVRIISSPQHFAGGLDEEDYEARIGGTQRADMLRSGRGAWQLIQRYATRPVTSVLEIGAGGGTCTMGLISEAQGVDIIATDTSPTFLRMIDRKLELARMPRDGVHLATLAGEELHRLPAELIDAVVISSALHHVSDWQAFMREAARILAPGGVLVIQEPCREGNLMMAMMLDIALADRMAVGLSADDARRVAVCRDTIYVLSDSRAEKTGEDKHNFLATQLAAVADESGFSRSVFYSNAHFQELADTDLGDRHRFRLQHGEPFVVLVLVVPVVEHDLSTAAVAAAFEPPAVPEQCKWRNGARRVLVEYRLANAALHVREGVVEHPGAFAPGRGAIGGEYDDGVALVGLCDLVGLQSVSHGPPPRSSAPHRR
jgi:SAM-dependent methyltransferase